MKAKKIFKAINTGLDVVEFVIPIITFCILFVSFVWAVVCRYVLSRPCSWATDIELGCYIWTVLFAASYVMRQDGHVRFTIVYDLLGPKLQTAMRIISNLMIIIPFSLLVKPAYTYISTIRTISPALQISMKYTYMPMIWFIVSVIVYAFRDLLVDVVGIFSPKAQAVMLEVIGKKQTTELEIVEEGGC